MRFPHPNYTTNTYCIFKQHDTMQCICLANSCLCIELQHHTCRVCENIKTCFKIFENYLFFFIWIVLNKSQKWKSHAENDYDEENKMLLESIFTKVNEGWYISLLKHVFWSLFLLSIGTFWNVQLSSFFIQVLYLQFSCKM